MFKNQSESVHSNVTCCRCWYAVKKWCCWRWCSWSWWLFIAVDVYLFFEHQQNATCFIQMLLSNRLSETIFTYSGLFNTPSRMCTIVQSFCPDDVISHLYKRVSNFTKRGSGYSLAYISRLYISRDSRKSRQKSGKTRHTLKKIVKNTASKYDVFSIATHLQCPFLSHW